MHEPVYRVLSLLCAVVARVPLGTNLARRQRVPLLHLHVWVQPLDALIAYKELIGRSADVTELRTLENRQ